MRTMCTPILCGIVRKANMKKAHKSHKGVSFAKGKDEILYGSASSIKEGGFGIKLGSLPQDGDVRITSEEIQSMYRDLSRTIKAYAPQGYMISTRVFAHIGVSSKGAEAKMGKSKGSIAYWCAKVYPGKLLFQIHGVSKATAAEGKRSIDRKTGYSLQLVCL